MNIRSINCNLDRFLIFLTKLELQIDIIVLSESWTDSDTIIPTINGYDNFSTKKTYNQNDGVVAYVKSSISVISTEINIKEGNCLRLDLPDDLTIICTYRPSTFKNPTNYINSLNSFLQTLQTGNIIFTGDVNIDTLPGNATTKTNDYLNMMAFHGLRQGIDKATRQNACLDHFMVKCKYDCHTFVFDAFTDHSPILIHINKPINKKPTQPFTKSFIDYECIRSELKKIDWDFLYSCKDVNEATANVSQNIQTIISKNTTVVTISKKLKPLKPWITIGMMKSIRIRDKLFKKTKKQPNDINLLQEYSNYRQICNKIIKHAKKEYYANELKKTAGNNKETWKVIKELCNLTKSKEPPLELLKIKDLPVESLNEVNTYFTSIGSELAGLTMRIMKTSESALVTGATDNFTPLNCMYLAPTDTYEIERIIVQLDSNSAAGGDKISARILKLNCDTLLEPIAFLCNLSFSTGVFPTLFKSAVVCPIFKSGERDKPTNYRPIALLPILSKIIEKLVNRRLINYANNSGLISINQYGFRSGISTEDAVLKLTSMITDYVDQGESCVGVFLDLQKAFDTVSIPILLRRLENLGIRGTVLSWFEDYLTNRQQCVRLGSYLSESAKCTYGVPQGSTLGPSLFLLYINSLCNLSIPGADLVMFADDTVVLFHGKTWPEVRVLTEKGLCRVTTWLEDNLLTINALKTKYLCFSKTKANEPDISFEIKIHTFPCNRNCVRDCSCTVLARVPTVKYLGVILDDKLNWSSHISSLSGRARKLIHVFRNLRLAADQKLLISTYKALCQSILTYCICTWGCAAKTYLLEVERAQRAILKVALGLPYRYSTDCLYKDANVLPIRKLFIYQVLRRFHSKVVPSEPLMLRRVPRFYIPSVKSAIGQRHFNYIAPKLYNMVLLEDNQLVNFKNFNFKKFIINWLSQFDYESTEDLFYIQV